MSYDNNPENLKTRRAYQRMTVDSICPLTMLLDHGININAMLSDISQSGAQLALDATLTYDILMEQPKVTLIGFPVEFEWLNHITGIVVWHRSNFCGIAFDKVIDLYTSDSFVLAMDYGL